MLYFVTHPDYDIPLPPEHRFSASKFSALMSCLIEQNLTRGVRIIFPHPVTRDDLARVHDRGYIDAVAEGTLDPSALRVLGLPWSERLARRSFLAPAGTYLAAKKALAHGLACHAAGGTHHAHYSHGAGFCVFNDLAYAATRLIERGEAGSVLILDADVHQGDGTARILEKERAVFTCSLHCAKNYPARKAESDLDVEVPRGTGDELYLAILNDTLHRLMDRITPDLVLYDAGVDVHRGDTLGWLDLSDAGILARDEMVLDWFCRRGIPVATVIGGGYIPDQGALAARHALIFRAAREVYQRYFTDGTESAEEASRPV
ncbi:histone deacetylase [Alphaproteobacteria bacterium LSUCC0684]